MKTGKIIKLAIIEDDEDLRTAFESYCLSSKRLECIFSVDSTEKLIKYFPSNVNIDIAIVDLELPQVDGFEAIKFVTKLSPSTDVVVLTVHQDYTATFKALKYGALGYLVKNLTFKQIEDFLIDLHDNQAIPLSPQIARRILRYFQPSTKIIALKGNAVKLTPKETLVVKHITKGNTYEETAKLMNITRNGVRHHIRNIYKKLHINSKAELLNLYLSGFFDNKLSFL